MKTHFFAALTTLVLTATLTATAGQPSNTMEKTSKTVRLIYPQWQGGHIAALIPEVKDTTAASQGYVLGAQLLNFLAPQTTAETLTVPVSMETERVIQDGVYDRDVIATQTRTALDMLTVSNPDRVVTLGGECSVSVVPFTYLANKYKGDVAMIWIDAHPDMTLPGEAYPAYHAMAVTALMGKGDQKIVEQLPAKFTADHMLFVGLRDWERDEIKQRQREYGIKHLGVADVQADSHKVTEWLKQCGASKVVVHFDMDVLDPAEIIPAVGVVKEGLKIDEVVRIISDIAKEKELVGLTVAEPMPRIAIQLKSMLERLPLMK